MTKTTPPEPPKIVDSHCHLDFSDFNGALDDIVTRATLAGVTRMVTICTDLAHETQVRKIAEDYSSVYYAAGTHPLHIQKAAKITVEDLVALNAHPKFVGIGESGLDYHYSRETEAEQKESLILHIEAARQTGLPLIIHARAADSDMAEILTHEHRAGKFDCVMHCFSSSAALAECALDLGFYLSMSGICAFKKSDELRAIFSTAPLDRVLVETDSPYLAPPPYRGKRCEPAFVTHTAEVGATIFGIGYEEFAAQTSANFDRLFTKALNRKSLSL